MVPWLESGKIFPTVSSKRFAVFCLQLRSLVKAGISVPESLEVMAESREYSKAFVSDLREVRQQLLNGIGLSDSFSACSRSFPDLFCALIYSAEYSGDLESVLDESAAVYANKAEQKDRVVSLMLYPCIVLITAFAVLSFLVLYILPVFENSFADFGMEMPFLTRVVTGSAGILLYLIPLLTVATVVLCLLIKARCKSDKIFAERVGRFCLQIPVTGNLQYCQGIQMMAGILEVMLRTGISLPQALEVAAETSRNKYLSSVFIDIQQKLYFGKKFSESLSQTGVFEPAFLGMIRLGEYTGDFEFAMSSIKEWYAARLNEKLDRLARAAEPTVIAVLGVIVGTVMLALFLPILQNYQNFSGMVN